jgi:hypothetical protein
MANLITEKQNKLVKTDYLIRLFSVSLLLLSLLGVFLLAYIIPYYISLGKKDAIVAEQFESIINAENKENTSNSVLPIINMTLEQMKAVELYGQNSFMPSVYFNNIFEKKNPSINITRLSFSTIEDNQKQFLVSGVSKDRQGLVNFIDDLKSITGFISVESPISDFAKDSDISFTLNIKTAI